MPTLNEVLSILPSAESSASEADRRVVPSSTAHSGSTQTRGEAPAPPLAGRKAPYYVNQQERPAHRVMLELAAQGYDVKEIASMTGYTTVCVNNILRQPYAQQTLVDEIRRVNTVDQEVVQIIKDNVVKSVKLYADVLGDPTVAAELRLKAAEAFLNRRYGKPNQPFSQGDNVDLKTLSDEDLLKMSETTGTATSSQSAEPKAQLR